jgi:phosphoglycolate phosphatase-like HAD superfamily hydrolase
MIRLVLFDIDGTLIQSGGAGEKAFARVCDTEFNVPNGTANLRFAGRTDPAIVREFFLRHQIEPCPENFMRFFDAYVFWLDHMLGQLSGKVLPGAQEMIAALRTLARSPAIGLLTGNIRLGAQIKLNHYKLWDQFQTGGFGDDHEDRNRIAIIARDRGIELLKEKLRGDQIVVVGDTPRDIECGKAIEAQTLAVATGSYGLEQLKEHKPTWAVETLAGVLLPELFQPF